MTIAPVAADVSEHNKVYTDAYGRRLLIFRATFGAHYLDQHFLANANQAARAFERGNIDGAVCYGVWLQSATPEQHYAFFWRQFGNKVPDWLVAVMTDIETWRGTSYQNHGDHSKSINRLMALHAAKMRSIRAAWWYGNAGDISELYPGRDSRYWGIQAKYGPKIALDLKGAIGQQYSDGQTRWGVPKGYPISSSPFGNVDHNAFPGVKSFAELVRLVRPPHVQPAPAPKPTPAPAPAPKPPVPYYHPDGHTATGIVSPDGQWAAFLGNDGKIRIRKYDRTAKHGTARRTI